MQGTEYYWIKDETTNGIVMGKERRTESSNYKPRGRTDQVRW